MEFPSRTGHAGRSSDGLRRKISADSVSGGSVWNLVKGTAGHIYLNNPVRSGSILLVHQGRSGKGQVQEASCSPGYDEVVT